MCKSEVWLCVRQNVCVCVCVCVYIYACLHMCWKCVWVHVLAQGRVLSGDVCMWVCRCLWTFMETNSVWLTKFINNLQKRRGEHVVSSPEHCVTADLLIRTGWEVLARQSVRWVKSGNNCKKEDKNCWPRLGLVWSMGSKMCKCLNLPRLRCHSAENYTFQNWFSGEKKSVYQSVVTAVYL